MENLKVKKRNGRLEDFNVQKINASAERACEGIEEVSASEIVLDAQLQLFNKITTQELDSALIFSARQKEERDILQKIVDMSKQHTEVVNKNICKLSRTSLILISQPKAPCPCLCHDVIHTDFLA